MSSDIPDPGAVSDSEPAVEGVRIGAVSYLNARPLYEDLDRFAPGAVLVIDVPSRLAASLRAGDLDVALIPSIEYFRGASEGPGLAVLPDVAIASSGPVRSVKLFCRKPPGRIRRLALDEGSRTSQALARIWLARRHGVFPDRIEPHPLGVPIEESLADAILLIGDRAMTAPAADFVEVVDLAEAWNAWTGLPFVFALWVARRDVELGGLPEALRLCRDHGVARVPAIARRFAAPLGLDEAAAVDYLARALNYRLGDLETRGLRRFAREAADLGLAPEGVDLVFHQSPRRRDFAARR